MGKRKCEVCGQGISEGKRTDAKVCSDRCRRKKYDKTDAGKEAGRRKALKYRHTEKGREAKKRADAKYYKANASKWITPENLERAKYNAKARRIIKCEGIPCVCIECKIDWVKLEVHHKDKDWKNNDSSNLEYRCRICHLKVHGKYAELPILKDDKRRIPWTEEEILVHLKQAMEDLGDIPLTQTTYNKIAKGRPTSKTILKIRNWKDWMELLKK